MSLITYNDMSCHCPNCGNFSSFDFPCTETRILWSNQYGAKIRIFCENCRMYTDMKNVSGNKERYDSKPITWKIHGWWSQEQKRQRLEYLYSIKEKFKISYRGRPDVYEKFDHELAILEHHLREDFADIPF